MDISADGKDIVVGGKLDTHCTVYSFEKMKGLIDAGKRFIAMRGLGDAGFKREVAKIVQGAEESLLRDMLELQDRERRLVAYEIHDQRRAQPLLEGVEHPEPDAFHPTRVPQWQEGARTDAKEPAALSHKVHDRFRHRPADL